MESSTKVTEWQSKRSERVVGDCGRLEVVDVGVLLGDVVEEDFRPHLWDLVDGDVARDERPIDLAAEDDVHVVRQFVRFDADEVVRTYLVRCLVEFLDGDVVVAREGLDERVPEGVPERASAADVILEEPALGFVDARGPWFAQWRGVRVVAEAELVAGVPELVDGRSERPRVRRPRSAS